MFGNIKGAFKSVAAIGYQAKGMTQAGAKALASKQMPKGALDKLQVANAVAGAARSAAGGALGAAKGGAGAAAGWAASAAKNAAAAWPSKVSGGTPLEKVAGGTPLEKGGIGSVASAAASAIGGAAGGAASTAGVMAGQALSAVKGSAAGLLMGS